MIKDAKITTIYGKRGSGKSTRAKMLIKDCTRLIVYDPTLEYQKERCQIVNNIKDMLTAIKKGWQAGFRIAYQPQDNDDHVENVAEILEYIKKVQINYFDEKDDRKITVLIEEMHLSIPNRPDSRLRPVLGLINIGRHHGIEMIGVTQRISEINTTFRANTFDVYFFSLAGATEIEASAKIIGREWAEKLTSADTHCGVHFDNGDLKAIKNTLV